MLDDSLGEMACHCVTWILLLIQIVFRTYTKVKGLSLLFESRKQQQYI